MAPAQDRENPSGGCARATPCGASHGCVFSVGDTAAARTPLVADTVSAHLRGIVIQPDDERLPSKMPARADRGASEP